MSRIFLSVQKLSFFLWLLLIGSGNLGLSAQPREAEVASDTIRLSLRACILRALSNNLGVKRSELNVRTAKANVFAAYLNLLPNLNANMGAGRSWGRSIDPTSNAFVNRQNDFLSLGASSNLLLSNGLGNVFGIKQARADFERAENDLLAQRNSTIFSALTFYLNVLLNKELLFNARFQLRNTEEQLTRIEKMVEAGGSAPVDLLNIRTQRAQNQVGVVQAENTLNLSVLNLKQALLLPLPQVLEVRDDSLDMVASNLSQELNTPVEEIYAEALRTRPEVKSAALQVRSARLGLGVVRSAFWPSLSLSASANSNYSSVANRSRPILGEERDIELEIGRLRSNPEEVVIASIRRREVVGETGGFGVRDQLRENFRSSLSLNLFVPIFQRWSNRTNVQRSKIAYHTAQIREQEIRNLLRNDIELAYNAATSSLELYRVAQARVAAATESFRAMEQRYAIGAANYTDYQIQNNTLFQARSELVRAKYSFAFRKQLLLFYQGLISY